jgi:hypothetical protein
MLRAACHCTAVRFEIAAAPGGSSPATALSTARNLLHLARQLEDRQGSPSHGNDCNALKARCSFGFENPEHRV